MSEKNTAEEFSAAEHTSADAAGQKSGSNKPRKKKRRRMGPVRMIILIIALAVFCYAAYNLISIYLNYKHIDNVNNDVAEKVLTQQDTPVEINDTTVDVPFVYNHAALLAINPQAVGYLYIPSIDIRLPVVQGSDDDYYLHHAFDGSESSGGCLFESSQITGGLAASHVLIYGHCMKNGSMFGHTRYYTDQAFYNTAGNDVFYIYKEDKVIQYRIFSVLLTDPTSDVYTFNFSSQQGLQAYADKIKSYSMYDTGVSVADAKQIVSLSTCYAYDLDKRLVVTGIYVGEASLNN